MSLGGPLLPLMDIQLHGAAVSISYHSKRNDFYDLSTYLQFVLAYKLFCVIRGFASCYSLCLNLEYTVSLLDFVK